MRLLLTLFLSSVAFGVDCNFPTEPPGLGTYTLSELATGIDRPIKLLTTPSDPTHLYIVEQPGLLKTLDLNTKATKVVLDIKDRVTAIGGGGDERGFLGMAFHPKFATNRKIFVNYTTRGALRTHVSQFTQKPDGTFDPASEKLILEIPQPFSNHNGGEVAFGPDGYLYIGMGDGGSGGDPQGNGQKLSTLLGKILRIDIDSGNPYQIPSDNPFLSTAGAKKEIFAYGLRNPWRFSFDRVTGELYAGDVGQNKLEEVNVIKKGGNYGWNIMEGTQCYEDPDCSKTGLIPPVFEYPRSDGISITGGFVYRGEKFPALLGAYLFGDYGSGKIWGIRQENGQLVSSKVLATTGFNIVSFGEDLKGEILVATLSGKIYQLAADTVPPTTNFPMKLSQTGCFKTLVPLEKESFLVPYDVNAPLWSDGLVKSRYVRLPQAEKIHFEPTENLKFPIGTVFVKHFAVPTTNGTKPVETRFLVVRNQGVKGYTYRWNDAGTDADFLSGAATRELEIVENHSPQKFSYTYPSSSDCLRCHTKAANEVLGFTVPQLNKSFQLAHLKDRGVFDSVSDPLNLPRYPDPADASAPLDQRARTYLAVQCSHCHQPGNPIAQGPYDMRFDSFTAAQFFRTPQFGDMGISGANVITAGEPAKSILFQRVHTLDARFRMPPVATARRDEVGAALIRDWISSLH